MDTFIITGANAEPAQSIARRLCEMGARVYGIAGTFPEADFAFNEFIPVACDVTSPSAVAAEIEKILEREKTVSGVVFSTQYFACDAFEAMAAEEITLAVNALVSTPLVIARLVMPSLIASRGSVIAVSQNTVTPRGHVLNNITDAAMKVFTGTLFGELRDTGVKACHIFLQNNTGTPDPAAAFTNAPQSRIQPDIVAETVETVLRLRENNALTQIVLRPQATRETPHIPVSAEPRIRTLQVVRLPESKNYPPAEEPILTPKYRRPDYAPPRGQKALDAAEDAALEAEEFADDYVDPELRYLVKENAKPGNKKPVPAEQPSVEDPDAGASENRPEFDESGNPIRRKRKRRRKKKNRNGAMLIQPPQLGGQVASPEQKPVPAETNPAPEKRPQNPQHFPNPEKHRPEKSEPEETPAEKTPSEKPLSRDVPKQAESHEPEVKKEAEAPVTPKKTQKLPSGKKVASPRSRNKKSGKTDAGGLPEKAEEKSAEKPKKKPRKPRAAKPSEEKPKENAAQGE